MSLDLAIAHIKQDYSIVQLSEAVDVSTASENLVSLTVTPDEISLVAPTEATKKYSNLTIKAEHNWQVFKVNQTLEFELVGIISQLSSALAKNNISVFVLSTFNTDYILVKKENIKRAKAALASIGCLIS